jgi:hypothetical protein
MQQVERQEASYLWQEAEQASTSVEKQPQYQICPCPKPRAKGSLTAPSRSLRYEDVECVIIRSRNLFQLLMDAFI